MRIAVVIVMLTGLLGYVGSIFFKTTPDYADCADLARSDVTLQVRAADGPGSAHAVVVGAVRASDRIDIVIRTTPGKGDVKVKIEAGDHVVLEPTTYSARDATTEIYNVAYVATEDRTPLTVDIDTRFHRKAALGIRFDVTCTPLPG